MRHKTITLCPTSYEIAAKMDNFSAWIRSKLMEEQIQNAEESTKAISEYAYYCKKCDEADAAPVLRDHITCKTCGGFMFNEGLANRWSGPE